MRSIILFLTAAFLGSVFSAVALAEPPEEITVSAAISLKNAFDELGKLYEAKHKGTRVIFNYGASGALIAQIEGGAPVDVFASAAQKDMDEADKKGFIVPGSRVNFAANGIVLILPSGSRISVKSFEDLKSAGIGKIAVGNFRTVPAGRYAEEVFAYYKMSDAINGKLIFAENVRQVLDYVSRGEVDAGVVYSTDARVMAKGVRVASTAPEASHKPVVYPIAVVRATKKRNMAEDFITLVTSPDGRRILKKYGFNEAGP